MINTVWRIQTHVFPEEERQDGSSQFSQEDEEDEHEELKNNQKRRNSLNKCFNTTQTHFTRYKTQRIVLSCL